MKTQSLLMVLSLAFAGLAAGQILTPMPPAPQAATPAPPPAAPAQRSAAELEKLLAPIALYPDPLLATLLPASVYPLELVQAARFVADTNNLAKLDEQPWDPSVKAVARVPDAIKLLNDDLSWTIALGEAFLAQDKEVMDTIQALRGKARNAGTLQTTPQQIVTVTNMVIERTVEQTVVVVTNTVVQIQPSSPSIVYVPAYNPYTVYYPPPAYVYDPLAPLVTFTAGVAMGAIIANNCDWHHGGCYHGDVDIDVDVNQNFNQNVNRNVNRDGAAGTRPAARPTQTKWQPDASRLGKSGPPSAATSNRGAEARGWGASGAARPSTGAIGAPPSTGVAGARPSTGFSPPNRPTASPAPAAPRPAPSPSISRPSASPSPAPNRSVSSRPSPSGGAFGGVNSGASARDYGSRGSSSRSGGFSGGGGGGGGGGGRGGGGGGGGGRGGGGGGRR